MSSSLVVLVLGAGPNLGTSIAKSFASTGYKVAVASRSGKPSADGFLSLKADFTKSESLPPLFDAVKKEFGSAPNVVVYNAAAALAPPPDSESTLSFPVDTFVADLNVNTVSAYVAAQQAVLGWETLPKGTKKSFIYTGNILNGAVFPVPMMMNLGVGKCASAYWIGVADATYEAKGYR
jgi:NAD(P)-dependent dehydrogenase (short-subunit alcohol dehydrogenase family)